VSQLESLRQAGRALDPERVIAALDRSFALWSAADSRWRRRLAAELGLYSPEVLEFGFREGLRGWNAAALHAIRREEVHPGAHPPALTAVWLAGSIPTGAFAAIALPLLAGSAVFARPSSADPVSPALFAESLAEVDPEVGAAIALRAGEAVLAQADAVVAYGRDETIAELRARVPPSRVFVGYGHKLSVAAIGPQAALTDAARRIALDAALYDGRGCLSPAYVLVDDTPGGRARDLAVALATEFEVLRTKLPRGRLMPDEETALHERRASYAMSEATRVWLSQGSTDWGVLLGIEGIRPAPGTLRNVPVVPVSGLEGLARWCAELSPHLSSLGVEGWRAGEEALTEVALAGAGSRICPVGSMQLPRIEWRHDGRGAIEPLMRYIDVERGERA
jgi:hypothetical protein